MHARTLIAALLVLAATPSFAQKKPKAACGLDYLPFVEGAVWTYKVAAPENPLTPQQQAAQGVQAAQPQEVTIKVAAVENRGDSATIVLEESFRKVAVKTTHTCSKGGLVVDPSSFFWAGEPGGAMQMTLADIKHEGVSYPGGKAFKKGGSASESFKAKVQRGAAPGTRAQIATGQVEMERTASIVERGKLVVGNREVDAFRVEVALEGRGKLDGQKDTERELPAGANAVLWMAPGTGVVQVVNRFNEAWALQP